MDNHNYLNIFLIFFMLSILLILLVGVIICLCRSAHGVASTTHSSLHVIDNEKSDHKIIKKGMKQSFTDIGISRTAQNGSHFTGKYGRD